MVTNLMFFGFLIVVTVFFSMGWLAARSHTTRELSRALAEAQRDLQESKFEMTDKLVKYDVPDKEATSFTSGYREATNACIDKIARIIWVHG